jgi:hypothetical protein
MEEFNLLELAMAAAGFGTSPMSLISFQDATRISMRCTCGFVMTLAVEHGHPPISLSCASGV